MKLIILIIGFLFLIQIGCGLQTKKRLLCYYNSKSALRKDNTKFTAIHLQNALPSCTHLMYGYADINLKTFELSNIKLTLNITTIKARYPHLKIYLSLGGDKDNVDTLKYMNFLEAGKLNHDKFIQSAKKFLKSHDFDGLDLAFQFLRNKPQRVYTEYEMFLEKVKKLINGNLVVDQNANRHKKQYSEFVDDMKNSFGKEHLSLAMTVLPNVNSTWYFNIPEIQNNFDFITLFAFDFLTPYRNPTEADYTAPISLHKDQHRLPYYTIDYQVNHWINNDFPAHKLNLGIATYGRAWKLSIDSGLSGVPIVENTKGPADRGNLTKSAGLLSYSEICLKLSKRDAFKYVDKTNKYGNYAFKPADGSGNHGIWISFDDPKFAGIKADYVIRKNLGGMAVYDLSYDDYRSHCRASSFPILKSVSKKLNVANKTFGYSKR